MRAAAPDLAELAQALFPVVREAGRVIMDLCAGTVAATLKGDGPPVTEADRRAEAIILPALSALAPGIPVVSEESAAGHGRRHGGPVFLVDPLDGTREFLKRDGKGSFTVSIALVDGGEPVLGIMHAPALGRLFIGIAGQGVRELSADGTVRRLSVRKPSEYAHVAVASASHRDADTEAWLKANRIGDTVSIGFSLKFCLVAAGEADVYPRFGPTMEWDAAAGDAIFRAAGGMTRTPEGAPFVYRKHGYRNGALVAWGGGRP